MRVRRNKRLLLCLVALAAVLPAAWVNFTLSRTQTAPPTGRAHCVSSPTSSSRSPFRKPSELALAVLPQRKRALDAECCLGSDASRHAGVLRFLCAAAERSSAVGASVVLDDRSVRGDVSGHRLRDRFAAGVLRRIRAAACVRTLESNAWKWFGDSVIRLAISMAAGVAAGLGSLSFDCSQPEALVVVYGGAFGSVSVRRHADQADLDRSAVTTGSGP